jgi:hypothetical protein
MRIDKARMEEFLKAWTTAVAINQFNYLSADSNGVCAAVCLDWLKRKLAGKNSFKADAGNLGELFAGYAKEGAGKEALAWATQRMKTVDVISNIDLSDPDKDAKKLYQDILGYCKGHSLTKQAFYLLGLDHSRSKPGHQVAVEVNLPSDAIDVHFLDPNLGEFVFKKDTSLLGSVKSFFSGDDEGNFEMFLHDLLALYWSNIKFASITWWCPK